jgi:hypothetical protein
MSNTEPLLRVFEREVGASGATADSDFDIAECPFAGTVSAVHYDPSATITGANTNSRTVSLVNKKGDGSGTTVVATLALTSGVNATADTPKTIPLSGTAANLVVAAGDVLAWTSTHVGSSGLADPGGLVHVELSRGDVSA